MIKEVKGRVTETFTYVYGGNYHDNIVNIVVPAIVDRLNDPTLNFCYKIKYNDAADIPAKHGWFAITINSVNGSFTYTHKDLIKVTIASNDLRGKSFQCEFVTEDTKISFTIRNISFTIKLLVADSAIPPFTYTGDITISSDQSFQLTPVAGFSIPDIEIPGTGTVVFDLTALRNKADYYAAMAAIHLQTLKQVFCEGTIPAAQFEMTIKIPKVPVFDSKTGGIPHINAVREESLANVFGAWMSHFNISSEWVILDSKKMKEITASFLYCAYLFRSGLLNNLGMTLLIASEKMDRFAIQYTTRTKCLGIKYS